MEDYCVKNLFLKVALDKSCQLKKQGIAIFVEKFEDKGGVIELVLVGKTKKTFKISFIDEAAYLENQEYRVSGGRPVYLFEDMVTYLFILVNKGPVIGKLMYPGTEEKKFIRQPAIIPT